MMAGFQEYKGLDLPGVARQVGELWESEGTFLRSVSERSDAPAFIFYEGPPSANGMPGIHHAMARTIKDLFCRYKTQRGFKVDRKAGWDTHGLPVELQVEKELGITKEDIGVKVTVEDYNRLCREAVMKHTREWDELTRQMGYWVDLKHPYITYEPEYIETLWYLLKELYKKGYLYKGYTIQPYSPAAGTGLSSHELNQPGTYKNVKDVSLTAQFRLHDPGKLGLAVDPLAYFLAWTTTPWTLPANSALTVGAGLAYSIVQSFNPYTREPGVFVLASARRSAFFATEREAGASDDLEPTEAGKPQPWRLLREVKGSDLEGLTYEQLMPYVTPEASAFRVITGDFVTTEDGTGIVHTSPTFGADDFRVAKQAGIPSIMVKDELGKEVPIVDKQGRFVKEVTDFAGMYVKNYTGADETAKDYKSTDTLIALKLKAENKAFRIEKYEHTYPHCWRTDKPVLYYPLESWFIKTTACKDRLIELNKTINWKPESTGTGRFGNWLENLVDWNLSRSRYWGTPLPIWRSERGTELCIGSLQELQDELEKALNSDLLNEDECNANSNYLAQLRSGEADVHRPFVDRIVLTKDGEKLKRELDLVDVWFDSGAMPYAQIHYPFSGTSLKDNFPADFIAEGVDQTRGWFFTLHALSVLLFDSVAFKNVVSNGLVLDKDGNKMSKRLGNAVDPFTTLLQYGPDATRWYMVTNSAPWDNLKFNAEGIVEAQRKFFGTLYNTYQFFALYANLDGFRAHEAEVPQLLENPLDRWILSRLTAIVTQVSDALDNYDATEAGRTIQKFIDEDLSNWYVRLNRKRFWKGQLDNDKRAAYSILHSCLATVAQLMAPIAPFFADKLYRDLTAGHMSVHLTDWPMAYAGYLDADLENDMELIRGVSSLIHSARKKNKIKVRRPISRVLVPALSENVYRAVSNLGYIAQAETNIKSLDVLAPESDLIHKTAKLNFKTAGRKLGQHTQEVGNLVASLTTHQVDELETQGIYQVALSNGSTVQLMLEDVEFKTEDVPGWVIAQEDHLTVALDLEMSEELVAEGFARELVNRIQNMRKDGGMAVTDRIFVRLANPSNQDLVQMALARHQDYIMDEVQANEISLLNGEGHEGLVQVDVDEEKLSMGLSRIPV